MVFQAGTRLQARLFIPDFIYFSWFIPPFLLFKFRFLEQHPSGFPVSWPTWVGFALGFSLCPLKHIPVFYCGFGGILSICVCGDAGRILPGGGLIQ